MERKRDENNWRENILKIRDYSEEQFDKLIIYLSTGALIITIGFVKDIMDITKAIDKKLLIVSWICYIVAILFILLSHRTAVVSMSFELKNNKKISDSWDTVTKILNWLSFLVFVTGIILFLIFLFKNL